MDIFGGLERFFSDVVYPYRWPILAGALVAAAVAAAVGYRQDMHRRMWRHRLATAVVVVPLIAVSVPLGVYLLSPLFERSHLDEASPLVMVSDAPMGAAPSPAMSGAAATPSSSFTPRVVFEGQFRGADDFHFGRGKALLIETAPGRYALRVEEFSVRNGPDLFVYLTQDAEGDIDGALNLGRLKATDGAFNYEVPPGTDISRFASAIVWCRQFSVLFASAPLMAT